ncbi:helix-turn-helix domain-containing protein [Microbacterium sp.]|uniref:helix-turn-helix domain-containing protein n=1 Tax=Microbacterium sp. TaxID=51671 RepID=UPI0032420B56
MTVQIPSGAILLTRSEAQVLYQGAQLGELRNRERRAGRDTPLYRVLHAISVCVFTDDAAPGIEPRHELASEESREWWTVQQLARATGLSTRKIRLDAQENRLPATKHSGTWLITTEEASTYITRQKGTP